MRPAIGVLFGILSCAAVPGLAQDRDIQRALIQRQQQSNEFSLQLRQSQQRLQIVPGDLRQQQELESSQLQQRQRLETLDAQQLNAIQQRSSEADATRLILDRAHADRERQAELQRPNVLQLPPPQVRQPYTPTLIP